MIDPIKSAKQVFEMAQSVEPWAKVLMFSGGTDSMATCELCKVLNVKLDAIMFVNTGTGIPETVEFVRGFLSAQDVPWIEAGNNDAYRRYVQRKGFFGVGTGYNSAHSMAFHLLKQHAYTAALGQLRDRKQGRKIWLINGARVAESQNRDENMSGKYVKCDRSRNGQPASPNYWVSPILDWDSESKTAFLQERKCPINPVSKALCRSGECMCGTTQGIAARIEAEAFSPRWKEWLKPLDEYGKRQFGFGWGEPFNEYRRLEQRGQLNLFDDSPMCSTCRKEAVPS